MPNLNLNGAVRGVDKVLFLKGGALLKDGVSTGDAIVSFSVAMCTDIGRDFDLAEALDAKCAMLRSVRVRR